MVLPEIAKLTGIRTSFLPELFTSNRFPRMLDMNEEKLKNVFASALGIPLGKVVDCLAYQSIKQWDSIAHMALVAAIENEFGVMLDTDQILALSSVAVARDILRKQGVVFP